MAGDRHDMSDAEWEILRPALPVGRPSPARKNDRKVMDGIFNTLRSGAPWRGLPERYGPYATVYNCYNRWSKEGTWGRILAKVQTLADAGDDDDDAGAGALEERMINSSSVRVHMHGSGSLSYQRSILNLN